MLKVDVRKKCQRGNLYQGVLPHSHRTILNPKTSAYKLTFSLSCDRADPLLWYLDSNPLSCRVSKYSDALLLRFFCSYLFGVVSFNPSLSFNNRQQWWFTPAALWGWASTFSLVELQVIELFLEVELLLDLVLQLLLHAVYSYLFYDF